MEESKKRKIESNIEIPESKTAKTTLISSPSSTIESKKSDDSNNNKPSSILINSNQMNMEKLEDLKTKIRNKSDKVREEKKLEQEDPKKKKK